MRVALLFAAILLAGCIETPGATLPSDAGPFSATSVFEGTFGIVENASVVATLGTLAPLPDEVVVIPSDVDGVDIRIGIIRPDVPPGTRVPIIAVLSDFSHAREGGAYVLEEGSLEAASGRIAGAPMLVRNFVPHGYAIALVAWRGASGSGGCYDETGPLQAADLDQAVTWLGEQDWSNGRVGTIGGSYGGNSQWQVAAAGNPYLKTVVPIASITSRYDQMYRNGTGLAHLPQTADPAGFAERYATDACFTRGQSAISAAYAHSYATGDRDALGYWAERDYRARIVENYEGSVLLVTGFTDWTILQMLYPWIDELDAKGLVVKHLLGQWGHVAPDHTNETRNPTPRADYAEILLHWFDRWLKEDASTDLGPRVQVADTAGHWRNEERWPPRDAMPLALALTAQGGLADAGGAEGNVVLLPEAAWSADAPCVSCATFVTEPFAKEVRFAGEERLHLDITPAGAHGNLVASLFLDDESGSRLLTAAFMDLRFAAGGSDPSPVVPGQRIVARMAFLPQDVVVPEGASLRLVVGQGRDEDTRIQWMSLNGQTTPLRAAWGLPPLAPIALYVGGDDSTLTLDVFGRGPGAFFDAPPMPEGPS